MNGGFFGQEQLGWKNWVFGDRRRALRLRQRVRRERWWRALSESQHLGRADRSARVEHPTVLSSLRLARRVGRSGRQPGAFDKFTTFTGRSTARPGRGLAPFNLGNPDLKPEVATEVEGGFEAGALSGPRWSCRRPTGIAPSTTCSLRSSSRFRADSRRASCRTSGK